MTQYSANPIVFKKAVTPKKGTLITFKEPYSPFFFFKIVGGGTIPAQLEGGWMSQRDADNAQMKYEATKRKPKKGEVRQESETYISSDSLSAMNA
jgi:hypothetical protein